MSLTGGKRKVNKSLKSWVKFVKKVQKEEKLNYKEAIHRAKIRKDKGEKWMTGGGEDSDEIMDVNITEPNGDDVNVDIDNEPDMGMSGGRRRRRRTMRRSRSRRGGKRSRSRSRSRSRRHRRRH